MSSRAAARYLEQVFRTTERENRRAILRLLPQGRGGDLLDIGTNLGAFTTKVAAHLGATSVAGIEFIPEHAEAARARGIDVVVADIDDGLPFGDAQFDIVHANQVIEHVRHTDEFLRGIRRVLRPGGLALISTNNLASWHNVGSLALGLQPTPAHVSDEIIVGNPLDPHHGRHHADKGQSHLRLFTGRALMELCAAHDLEQVAWRTAGYYPLPPGLGRLAARLDRAHGAFLVALVRRHRE